MMDKIFIRTLEMQKESLLLSQANLEHDIAHCYDKITLLSKQKKKVKEHVDAVVNQINKAILNG